MYRTKIAFTLVEILASIVIVLALMAIVAAVYRYAIRQGKLTDEISRLHQIALAANLYHEQADGWPANTTSLVQTGLVTRDICKSPRDIYSEGWANRYLKGLASEQRAYRNVIAPFPNSFVGFGDIRVHRREKINQLFQEQANPGLFVSLIESKNLWPNENPTGPFDGIYRRVLLDGSVVIRRHKSFTGENREGKPVKMMSDDTWFFDPDEQWIKALLTTQ